MLELRFPLSDIARQQAARVRSMIDAGRRREVGLDLAKDVTLAVEHVRPVKDSGTTWLVAFDRLYRWDADLRPLGDWPLPLLLPEHAAAPVGQDRPVLRHHEAVSLVSTGFRLAWRLDEERTHWVWHGTHRGKVEEVGLLFAGGTWSLCDVLPGGGHLKCERLADGGYVFWGEFDLSFHDHCEVEKSAWVCDARAGHLKTVDYDRRPRGTAVPQHHLASNPSPFAFEPVGEELRLGRHSFPRPAEYPATAPHYKWGAIYGRSYPSALAPWTVDAWSGEYVAARCFKADAT